jgi:hypothetical protein
MRGGSSLTTARRYHGTRGTVKVFKILLTISEWVDERGWLWTSENDVFHKI